jgi:AraC-like DNA-binding protein
MSAVLTPSPPALGATTHWPVDLPPAAIPPRVHDDEHLLLWQVRGTSTLHVDGVAHVLTMGHALWLPAGVGHRGTVHANSVLLPMFFPVASAATTLRRPTLISVDREMRNLFLAEVQMSYTVIQPAIDLSSQILALIESCPAASTLLPMPTSESARAVADHLRRNPGDPRGLTELAAQVHTSVRSLERIFLAETGTTVRAWRMQARMETAATLLRAGATVGAVASRVGYADAASLRRAFRRHYGMGPAEYAQTFSGVQ